MKTDTKLQLGLAALLAVLTGCAALKGTDPDTLTRLENIAFSAAKLGTAIALKAQPDSRQNLVNARDAFSAMIAANRSDVNEITQILANSGLTKLQGDYGDISIIEGGLFLYDVVSALYWSPESKDAVTTLIVKLRDGMTAALAPQAVARDREAVPSRPERSVANTRRY